MNVKKGKWLVVLLTIAMLATVGSAYSTVSENGNGCGECGPYTTPLIAGQNMEVGTVTVTNDGEKVCVTYALNEDALEDDWLIYETHLYIGTTDDFPLTRANNRLGAPYYANPIPGQFPYGKEFDADDGREYWTFCITLEELGAEVDSCLYVSAHAVVERVVEEAYCETISGEITPELTWMRSTEDSVANFPGKGAQWNPVDDGFTIPLDPGEVVWDGGTADQNVMDDTTPDGRWPGYNPELNYATYIYAYNDGDSHDGQADLRRFKATFDIPEGYIFTGGKLGSVNDGYEDMIPINDNIYIFVNEDLLFWGGTIPNATGISFEGMYGKQAVRGGESPNWDPVETDGWNIPGTIPDIDAAEFFIGPNVLDVFAEEYSIFGAMHELYLTLEYEMEECYPEIREDETAWGKGNRFNEKGNWGMWFKYKVCEPEPDCVEEQLLQNPGAESGMAYWEFTANVVRSIDEREQSTGMVYPLSGGYFFDFTGADVSSEGFSYMASMSQRVDVSRDVGCPFSAGGWIQTELWPDSTKTDIEDNDYGQLVVTFYDDTDAVLDSFDTGIIGNPVAGSPTTDGKQYVEFDLSGTIPAGADYAVYELQGYLIQGAFINVFYDDLYFWVGK